MITRNQLESILKINGISANSPVDIIRSVLLSAKYTKDETETAIMMLRGEEIPNKTQVDGLHKVFRTSEILVPDEMSKLLGIDVELSDRIVKGSKGRKIDWFQIISVSLLSIIFSGLGITAYMYFKGIGPFH